MSMELCWSDEDLEDVDRTAEMRGRMMERKRILAILKEEQEKRHADGDWGVIGIVSLMVKIEEEKLTFEEDENV